MSEQAIALCSTALIELGAEGISSFTDVTVESEIANSLYETVKQSLLARFPWNFATLDKELTRVSHTQINEYAYKYILPEGTLRVVSVYPKLTRKSVYFRVQGGFIYTNETDVYASCVVNTPESTFPPYFNEVLRAFLKAAFSGPLWSNPDRTIKLTQSAELALRLVRSIDAQEDTSTGIDDFSLINARL